MKKTTVSYKYYLMFGSINGLNLNYSGFYIKETDNLLSLAGSNLCPERSGHFNGSFIESCVPSYYLPIIHTSSGLFEFSQNENNLSEDLESKEASSKYLSERKVQKEVIFEIKKCPKLLLKEEANKSVLQDLTERLVLFLKKIPENDTLYMDMCDLVDGIKEDEKMKYFRRRLCDVLNVLEGIQYKLIARVVRKHSGKINCFRIRREENFGENS